ncbi:MAG: DUF4932 domain-containing protein [Armatimonadetes bacterium]|nr:DUF4932 domain-containing protein [Armatimonadota bacterium]
MMLSLLALSVLAPPKLIEVRVDPRIELVTAVFRLAEADEYNMDSSKSAYASRLEKALAPYKDHEAVRLAREIRERTGVGFDAVPTIAVHYSDIIHLDERVPFDLPPARWDKRWSAKDARAFTKALRSFVKDAHFAEFMRSEEPYFRKVAEVWKKKINARKPAVWLRDFYGTWPKRSPYVIVGMLCGGGNYGMSVEWPNGDLEMTPVLGAGGFDSEGVPSFGDRDLPLLLHEFSHGFMNPLAKSHFKELLPPTRKLMPMTITALSASAYATDEPVLFETFVRTAVQHLVEKHVPEIAAANRAEDRQSGFLWIDELTPSLREYEKNRARFPTMQSWFPKLVSAMKATGQRAEEIERRCPKVVRISAKWSADGEEANAAVVTVEFDRPMNPKSRGFSIDTEGVTVVKKTEFAPDGRSFSLTLRVPKGKPVTGFLNRFGRGLLSADLYPIRPMKVELNPEVN